MDDDALDVSAISLQDHVSTQRNSTTGRRFFVAEDVETRSPVAPERNLISAVITRAIVDALEPNVSAKDKRSAEFFLFRSKRFLRYAKLLHEDEEEREHFINKIREFVKNADFREGESVMDSLKCGRIARKGGSKPKKSYKKDVLSVSESTD